jgi:hypothetical protein
MSKSIGINRFMGYKNAIKDAFNRNINHKPLNFTEPIRTSRTFNFNLYSRKKIDYDRVLEFDHTFEKYLKEVEDITHRPLHPIQRKQIKYHLDHYEYRRLTSEESHEHRREFNHKKKEIIADWEKMTGDKWPTYDEPVYNSSGKMIRPRGARLDMHHILECSWGGDNEWWNMTPARHPEEHNQGIHRKNGMADKIFNS